MCAIVTFTANPALDKSSAVDHVVAERKLRCAVPRYEPGGGGLNVARAIRQLGGEAHAVYLAGGPTGEHLESLVDAAGIGQTRVSTAAWTRVNLSVLDRASGLQYRFGMPGEEVEPDEWETVFGALEARTPRDGYLVASGSFPAHAPDDFFGRLAALCNERQTRLVVDSSGVGLERALAASTYLIKPNLRELNDLTGDEIRGDGHLERVARRWVDDGAAQAVVVSLGGAGGLAVAAEGTLRVPAPTVPIRSKVGAGDSMVAGLVLALSRGQSFADAVRFGVAAGAAAVMTPGSELCRREDTERLFSQMS